jgi:hypothetical protein
MELDIYIPEKQIAIEFNGLYWHSERTKPKSYHYDKWLACKEVGIQLIQIWEDDWNRDPKLIKRMLAYKLGVNVGSKIYARKTEIYSPNKQEVDSFLTENHIQGAVDGSVRVGLRVENMLTAVAIFKLEKEGEDKILNLVRYATSQQVIGGFTKLLKAVEEKYAGFKKIITFSDNTLSDGGLYENSGFIRTKEIKPDYMYICKGQRYHKFGYRLKRFRTDPNLQYMEGLTESQLAELNGLERIWDAGRTVWEKTYD